MKTIKIISIFLLVLICQINAQNVLLSGSILEKEFTGNDRLSGLFTYMNNSDQYLIMESEMESESKSIIKKKFLIPPMSGKQIKVYKETFSAQGSEEKVYGNYTISFYFSKSEDINDRGALIVSYTNKVNSPPTLRGVSLLFKGLSEDSQGKYFEINIDWKTLYGGNQSDKRKCYLSI